MEDTLVPKKSHMHQADPYFHISHVSNNTVQAGVDRCDKPAEKI